METGSAGRSRGLAVDRRCHRRGHRELEASFAAAARAPICKGFAIGRSIFGQPAEEWLSGKIDDDGAVAAMTRAYGRLIEIWRKARKHATTAAAGAEPLKQIG